MTYWQNIRTGEIYKYPVGKKPFNAENWKETTAENYWKALLSAYIKYSTK